MLYFLIKPEQINIIMNNNIILNNIIFIFIIFFGLSNGFSKQLIAGDKTENSNSYNLIDSSSKSILQDYKSDYILGPGDTLSINFLGVGVYNDNYLIDPNGYLFLPEIKRIKASDKTLEELKINLEKEYQKFIYDPEINLKIIKYRPVNFIVLGEVKMTGLFTLKYQNDTEKSNAYYGSPKLFDGLKLVKGFTNYADLRNIKIIRNNSKSQGGGEITTTLDFLSLLKEGDQSVNINLMDGDTVIVPKSEKLIKNQIFALNKSNITPNEITIYISGNVKNPGQFSLKKGTSLVQAVSASGGQEYFTGLVRHIRFNEEGTKVNVFPYDQNAKSDTSKNPILLDGDIVRINKTITGNALKALQEVTTPIVGAYGLSTIFD